MSTLTALRRALAVASVPLALPVAPALAQVADHERVAEARALAETWLEAQQAYEQIPGLSAAVAHDQELVWSHAAGVANREEGVPATPGTLYSICSISKLFTSIALMQLRDRGLVDLRDPVSEHLPWFRLHQRYEGSPPVTVEGILTHSAGLPRESNQPYWTGPDFPFPTRDEIIAGLEEQETLYPARKYFQYSNLGLTLAGEIVAARSGMPYDRYVREHVLEPLGLDDTWPEIPVELWGDRLAVGYSAPTRAGTRERIAPFQAKGIAPAAGYASTAEDLARFAMWQFRLTGDRDEVLHAHTLDEMHRVHYVDPSFDTYWGLGFNIARRDGKTFVGHGGSCPGYRSQLLIQKDERVASAFMANAMVNSGGYARGLWDIFAPAIGEAAEEGGAPATAAASDGDGGGDIDFAAYVGTYSEQPWGSESAVVKWKGGLATLGLPTMDPAGRLTRLGHDSGDVFYRIRDDGERGEDVVFERDARGRVTGMRVHGNFSPRIRP